MTTLKGNVTLISNDKSLTPDEKLQALEVEVQQTLYSEEEYNEAKYGKGISIFDPGINVEDAEERNNTSLDPLYLEEGVDVELLFKVRQLHNREKEISDKELNDYDKLDDCLSINHSGRDKKKFAVMNCPGFRTVYHHIPGGGMTFNVVKDNAPYKRKVIWNEEGNFEDIESNDKPDWLTELEDVQEEKEKDKKLEHKTKILWKAIKDTRKEYKKFYDAADKTSMYGIITDETKSLKRKGDKAYKEYKYYSNAMDKVKELDAKAEAKKLEAEIDMILSLFVELQQKCPDNLVETVLREDIKEKYKKEGYERTRYYLVRLIRRAEILQQEKKYKEKA